MKILSVNAGSSSLKFTLFEMPEEKEIVKGLFERIGIEGSFYTIKYQDYKIKQIAQINGEIQKSKENLMNTFNDGV